MGIGGSAFALAEAAPDAAAVALADDVPAVLSDAGGCSQPAIEAIAAVTESVMNNEAVLSFIATMRRAHAARGQAVPGLVL